LTEAYFLWISLLLTTAEFVFPSTPPASFRRLFLLYRSRDSRFSAAGVVPFLFLFDPRHAFSIISFFLEFSRPPPPPPPPLFFFLVFRLLFYASLGVARCSGPFSHRSSPVPEDACVFPHFLLSGIDFSLPFASAFTALFFPPPLSNFFVGPSPLMFFAFFRNSVPSLVNLRDPLTVICRLLSGFFFSVSLLPSLDFRLRSCSSFGRHSVFFLYLSMYEATTAGRAQQEALPVRISPVLLGGRFLLRLWALHAFR